MRIRYRELECFKKVEKGWINSIPDIWNCANLGYFCEFIMGQAPYSDTYNTIGEGTIFIKAGDFGKKYPKVTNYTINPLVQCKKGDILICVVGATSGKINFAIDGSISRSVAALRVKKELDKRYLYYFLDYSYQNINDLANGSAQGIINKDILKNIVIPLPNKETQQKISNFLDKKTAQFDSIISKKEALIEKLEEAKKSLISEVVTGKVRVVKTNDGYELVERKKEEMKDSGVEWLGDIPKEWSTTKLKLKTSQINRGKSPEYVDNSNIKVINQACIYWDEFKFQNVKYQDESIKSERGKLYKNDILINSTGTGTLGRANIFYEEGEYIVDSHVTIIRCLDEEYSRYINKVLRTDLYQGLIYSTMVTGSTNQIELSREGLRNMIVLDLSKEELININNLLEVKINDINSTIIKSHLQIEKLKEAKLSLISEAVTGKIEILD